MPRSIFTARLSDSPNSRKRLPRSNGRWYCTRLASFILANCLARCTAVSKLPSSSTNPSSYACLADSTAVLFAGVFAAFGDNLFEALERFVNQGLNHLLFLRQNILLVLLATEHVLELAALEHLRPDSDLVEQAPIIVTVHNDPDAAGDGQFIGDNPTAGRRNVITARRRQTAHRGHDRLFVILFKISNRTVDFIRGQHLAARGIDSQYNRFRRVVLAGHAQLVGNQVHQAMGAAVPGL